MPNIGALFAGFGGLELAAQRVWEDTHLTWVCEHDPRRTRNQPAARVLAHHWPGVPNLGDITAVDWSTVEPVDVITGGFPCQDVSTAGARSGLIRGSTRSGMWSHMASAIGAIRPNIVIIENVRGILSATADSDVEPCPWCMGDPAHRQPAVRALGAVLGDLADIGYDAAWTTLAAADVGAPHQRERVFVVAWPAAHHPNSVRRQEPRWSEEHIDVAAQESHAGRCLPTPCASDSCGSGNPGRSGGRDLRTAVTGPDMSVYTPAIRRWERLTRPAPDITTTSRAGRQQLSARFVEWLMGLPDGWVTQVPGLTRTQQLRVLGNGVVPQQAARGVQDVLSSITQHTSMGAA